MADMCLYEPIHGDSPDCDGACKKGEGKYCPYYFVDEVCQIIRQWKNEAKVETPILTKYDRKRRKLIIYTTRPGFLIGRAGERLYRYEDTLRDKVTSHFIDHRGIPKIEHFIEFVECDDAID